ncbi:MAG TPA: NF038122 family metalloprotease [Acetobacteraceae bacterium]|nr:NF038122 family metalloprotease [Acetobacteraceae bacterium]
MQRLRLFFCVIRMNLQFCRKLTFPLHERLTSRKRDETIHRGDRDAPTLFRQRFRAPGWRRAGQCRRPGAHPALERSQRGSEWRRTCHRPDLEQRACPTASASISPFVIKIIWDPACVPRRPGFVAGVQAAVQYLETQFVDPVTINLHVGYGEVNGTTFSGGTLGASWTYLTSVSYAQLVSALTADAKTAVDASAVASLPAMSLVGGSYLTTFAEARALGLLPATSSSVDGSIGFSSTAGFTYNDSNGVAAGTYDFNGTALHEITEVMGRDADWRHDWRDDQQLFPVGSVSLSSLGVRDFVQSTPGYFSIDGGNSNLGAFNTPSGGDVGDWASSVANDAFDAYATVGVVNSVSSADLTELDAIGLDPAGSVSSPPPSQPTGVSISPVTASLPTDPAAGGPAANSALATLAQVGGAGGDSYTCVFAARTPRPSPCLLQTTPQRCRPAPAWRAQPMEWFSNVVASKGGPATRRL